MKYTQRKKITKKIRENLLQKSPYILWVGEENVASFSVASIAPEEILPIGVTVDIDVAIAQNEIDKQT